MSEDPLVVPDTAAWRSWLDVHEGTSDGVWVRLAKKGTTSPTTLSYAQALDEALCSGWIDGQRRGFDETTFVQRFTPRRRDSTWSQRNVGLVEELIAQERMRPRGRAEIDAARADGRWDRAYPGAATVEIPEDLDAALADSVAAKTRLMAMPATQRYPLLLPILTAAPTVRAARIARLVRRLEKETGGTAEP